MILGFVLRQSKKLEKPIWEDSFTNYSQLRSRAERQYTREPKSSKQWLGHRLALCVAGRRAQTTPGAAAPATAAPATAAPATAAPAPAAASGRVHRIRLPRLSTGGFALQVLSLLLLLALARGRGDARRTHIRSVERTRKRA
eukprot:scaffold21488_cov67-Phaeocystis_antarctica.AAC.1